MMPWHHSIHPPFEKMHSLTAYLLVFLFASATCHAASFNEGNAKYRSGDYAAAVASYESLLATVGPRASVYYNLGNSYHQLRQYGNAILAYERALLLTPRDPDLLANLARARKSAAAFEEPAGNPWLHSTLRLLSLNEWSWLLAGSSLILGLLAIVSGIFIKFRRRMAIAACAAALAITTSASVLHLRRGEFLKGIVLTDTATLRLSPFENAETLGTPGPGRSVVMGKKSGDFQYVEVPSTNLKGWLATKDVAAIVPQEFPPISSPSSSTTDTGPSEKGYF
jgi:hypothetical protein